MSEITEKMVETIKRGTPAEVREAQKLFEKYWDSLCLANEPSAKKAVFDILLREIRNLDSIPDETRQAYLINALRFRLWAGTNEHFEELRDFVLKYIQHPSGKVRVAIVRACDYLALDCGMLLQFAREKRMKGGVSSDEEMAFRRARLRFGYFVHAVEALLLKYDEPRFRRCKYVQSIPPSVYKSLQQLLVEKLLRTEFYREMYEEFLRETSREGCA